MYSGVLGTMRHIFRAEGVRGLYRGFVPSLVGVPSFWMVYFTGYATFKDQLGQLEFFQPLPPTSDFRPEARTADDVSARHQEPHTAHAPSYVLSNVAVANEFPLGNFLGDVFRQGQQMAKVIFYPQNWLQFDQQTLLHIGSAFCAGAVADTMTNPIWVVRTRLMTQHTTLAKGQTPPYRGVFGTLNQLRLSEGFGSWYRGLSASFLGLSHVMIQFPLYEHLKVVLPQVNGRSSPGLSDLILASSSSKLIAAIFTYPHEVLRMRLQNTGGGAPLKAAATSTTKSGGGGVERVVYKNIFDCARRTVGQEGFRALYQGFMANACKTVPASALTFVTYEWLISSLGRWDTRGVRTDPLGLAEDDPF